MNAATWALLKGFIASKTSHGKNQVLDEMVRLEIKFAYAFTPITKNELLAWLNFKLNLLEKTVHSRNELLITLEALEKKFLKGKTLADKTAPKKEFKAATEALGAMKVTTKGTDLGDTPF